MKLKSACPGRWGIQRVRSGRDAPTLPEKRIFLARSRGGKAGVHANRGPKGAAPYTWEEKKKSTLHSCKDRKAGKRNAEGTKINDKKRSIKLDHRTSLLRKKKSGTIIELSLARGKMTVSERINL